MYLIVGSSDGSVFSTCLLLFKAGGLALFVYFQKAIYGDF
ncbi:hypothetical protein FLA_0421 [Filimonas lacunae]|nr:hypothetical protein FLA_0421 [Filimonas lacunae]